MRRRLSVAGAALAFLVAVVNGGANPGTQESIAPAQLPLPWIMGYDVEPLVTLETKRVILKRAVQEEWLVVFEHDAKVAWSQIENDGKSYRARQ